MAVSGVYKVSVVQFQHSYEMELHIKENKFDVVASLKDNVYTRSFYDGRTILWVPDETESHNFIFYNAQVDEYTNLTPSENVNLVPPGGYHIGGVELAGTVLNDIITGTIKFKNGTTSSVHGTRIKGEPIVNTKFRTDCLVGVNRYCPCTTASCPHHGFCDSCTIFDSLHASVWPVVTHCLESQYKKYVGPLPQIDSDRAEGHGLHHLLDNEM